MIIRLQAVIFLLIGMVAWHGVDSAIIKAEQRGEFNILKVMTVAQLTEIEVLK
jgi:hypothetical protein